MSRSDPSSDDRRSYTSDLDNGYRKTTLLIDSETRDWSLEVWEIAPGQVEAPYPTVVMGHGFGLCKEHGLEEVAANFAKHGIASLVLDYRHFGGSDGQPRNVLSPSKQTEDYYTVVKYARQHPKLYEARSIGIWGFSFAGGHVMSLAAWAHSCHGRVKLSMNRQDDHIAFVIAQNPYTCGLAQAASMNPFHCLRLGLYSAISIAQKLMREPPVYIRACGKGKRWGVLSMKEAAPGYASVGFNPDDDKVNRVDADIALKTLFYDPVWFGSLGDIRVPFLACIGNTDTMVPWKEAHDAVKKVQKATLFDYRGNHFSAFKSGPAFEEVSRVQIKFIKMHSLGTMSERLDSSMRSVRSRRSKRSMRSSKY